MMTTRFVLDHPIHIPRQHELQEATYSVPTLPAYTIEHAELWAAPGWDGADTAHFLLGRDLEIAGQTVIWHGYRMTFSGRQDWPVLVVHYHGVRDYELLFPAVDCVVRRGHLGRLYEEAQKSFDVGAWLAFCLMCGGVFEGMLWSAVRREFSLSKLIARAKADELISKQEASIIDHVRLLRNRVHINRAAEPYVGRREAMDTRKVLEDLVKRFSYGSGAGKPRGDVVL